MDEGLLKHAGDSDEEGPLITAVFTGICPILGVGYKLVTTITEWLKALFTVAGVRDGFRSSDIGF